MLLIGMDIYIFFLFSFRIFAFALLIQSDFRLIQVRRLTLGINLTTFWAGRLTSKTIVPYPFLLY